MECNGEGEIEGQCETCGGDGQGPLTEDHKQELQDAIEACPE
jgi:ferredoxin